MAKAAVRFYGDRDEVWMWISSSFVLLAALCGVVCVRRCVRSCGGLRDRIDYADVNVVGGRLVVGYDVEFGLLVVWSAHVSVELRDVDLKLCVMSVLLEPFLENADDVVVAVYSVAPAAARCCVLSVVVEWV